MGATTVEERSVVTTRIPGRNWLDVEVQFAGREARRVTAKWAGGAIEMPVDVLHRIQSAVLGSRSAVGDGRGCCQLHGFHAGYSWSECATCEDEKKALTAPAAPQKQPNGAAGDAF